MTTESVPSSPVDVFLSVSSTKATSEFGGKTGAPASATRNVTDGWAPFVFVTSTPAMSRPVTVASGGAIETSPTGSPNDAAPALAASATADAIAPATAARRAVLLRPGRAVTPGP